MPAFIGRRANGGGRRGRNLVLALGAIGLAAIGLGYCSDQFGFDETDVGRGIDSEIIFPASELETTLAVVAVQNSIELRVTHDIEVFGRTQDIYTDIYPAQVPGFLELRIEDLPDIEMSSDGVTVTVARDEVYVQERVEQLREPATFTVEDGRITEGRGLPIDRGTRVFLEDGTYSTGEFDFDPEGSESVLTKIADGVTLGLTDISAGTTANILRIAQLATLNPACLRAADEVVGLDVLIAGGIEDHFVAQGFRPEDIDVAFTGEYPDYDQFPDETGATFDETRVAVQQALRGGNRKTIELAADCDADAVVESDSVVSLSSESPPAARN